ncbi:MAG TPA: potassium channel family protein [Amycolatopsis sp.]|nr:potassium channel family protein [Amycolatopsis sp.]
MTPAPAAPDKSRRLRFLLLGVLRPLLTIAVLVTAYYVLPIGQRLDGGALVWLVAGLVVVTLLVVWEVRRILRSGYPLLQGIQALAIVIPLFLLVFAAVYRALDHAHPGSFTGPLTKTDALYFVVTVFATVGFGDVTAVTATARILVTIQMVADLIVLGLVLRVIVTAVQRSRGGNP